MQHVKLKPVGFSDFVVNYSITSDFLVIGKKQGHGNLLLAQSTETYFFYLWDCSTIIQHGHKIYFQSSI